jgi:hypothetical protein
MNANFTQDDYLANLKPRTIDQILDTCSTIESKFDTPGPGTYDIKGYFRNQRDSTIIQKRFKAPS